MNLIEFPQKDTDVIRSQYGDVDNASQRLELEQNVEVIYAHQ